MPLHQKAELYESLTEIVDCTGMTIYVAIWAPARVSEMSATHAFNLDSGDTERSFRVALT
jgi:hypothetical protein